MNRKKFDLEGAFEDFMDENKESQADEHEIGSQEDAIFPLKGQLRIHSHAMKTTCSHKGTKNISLGALRAAQASILSELAGSSSQKIMNEFSN